MLLGHVAPLNIVQSSIVTFSDNRRQRIVGNADIRILCNHPTHKAVGHARDVERIREGDGIFKKSGLGHPSKAGHFTSAIEDKRACRNLLVPDIVARNDNRHARADRALPGL